MKKIRLVFSLLLVSMALSACSSSITSPIYQDAPPPPSGVPGPDN